MKYLSYLFAGYAVAWILIFGYTWYLGRKQSQLAKELKSLEESLKNN